MLYLTYFADDAAVVTVDEVVYIGDAASRRILDGQDAVAGLPGSNGLNDVFQVRAIASKIFLPAK